MSPSFDGPKIICNYIIRKKNNSHTYAESQAYAKINNYYQSLLISEYTSSHSLSSHSYTSFSSSSGEAGQSENTIGDSSAPVPFAEKDLLLASSDDSITIKTVSVGELGLIAYGDIGLSSNTDESVGPVGQFYI